MPFGRGNLNLKLPDCFFVVVLEEDFGCPDGRVLIFARRSNLQFGVKGCRE